MNMGQQKYNSSMQAEVDNNFHIGLVGKINPGDLIPKEQENYLNYGNL